MRPEGMRGWLKWGGWLALLMVQAGVVQAQTQTQTQTVVKYVHTDVLGSVVAITDSARNVIERREYEPYGQQLIPAVQDGPGYTGHIQDAATGLTYMQQRYYDPICGCFLSVDPVTAYSNPVGQFHRYRYANSNPYGFADPDGRMPETGTRLPNGSSALVKSFGGGGASSLGSGRARGTNMVAHNGRDRGVPIQSGTSQIRYDAANRAVDKVRDGVEQIPHSSPDEAANAFNAMLQPIVEKYGLEIEATIDSSVERYKLGGVVVGNQFRKDGIGFTVNSPSDGRSTVHGHPLSTFEQNGYRPFSSGDLNWYRSSPGIPHFVTSPEGVFRYDGVSKSVIKVD